MVIPVLGTGTGMENMVFSFGGGGLLGFMAGMAFKRIVKFVAIIVGLFVLGLAFLSYREWITANWNTIQDQTQSFAYNASAQVLHMVNDTASKFVTHPSLTTEATPISAAIGFTAGFALGVRHWYEKEKYHQLVSFTSRQFRLPIRPQKYSWIEGKKEGWVQEMATALEHFGENIEVRAHDKQGDRLQVKGL